VKLDIEESQIKITKHAPTKEYVFVTSNGIYFGKISVDKLNNYDFIMNVEH
jgi:hypothetical protein